MASWLFLRVVFCAVAVYWALAVAPVAQGVELAVEYASSVRLPKLSWEIGGHDTYSPAL